MLINHSTTSYDFFYKNGVPVWRGTGYYYSRFRPGLGVSGFPNDSRANETRTNERLLIGFPLRPLAHMDAHMDAHCRRRC